ncbi:MAG: outer membrane protein assembly factor BamE [Geminicoccaceae bacterium]|nr:outer membrane protein assembly factor BamE [Geminicoccaceae bacterium]
MNSKRNDGLRSVVSKKSIAALLLVASLTGCSVGMAMSGSENPDLAQVRPGATRGEVELQLGSPVKSHFDDDGDRTDVYIYEIGNEPSAGRAIGHGVMDVLTLGLWEIVGTPVEGFQGEKFNLTVRYDKDDVVRSIKSNKVQGST